MNDEFNDEVDRVTEAINRELALDLERIQAETKLKIQKIIDEKSAKLDARLLELVAKHGKNPTVN
jgi:vacuolar-type H+-ATPase subunit E/Vma4